MRFSESIFAMRFNITPQDLEGYLAEALAHGGNYADLYFEYLQTSSISIDESMVKSATQGVSMGVGGRGPGRAGFFPERENARTFREGGCARGPGDAGRRGGPGGRNDGGAGTGVAGNPAARSGGPRPGSGFQPQGRFGLQRARGPEGG